MKKTAGILSIWRNILAVLQLCGFSFADLLIAHHSRMMSYCERGITQTGDDRERVSALDTCGLPWQQIEKVPVSMFPRFQETGLTLILRHQVSTLVMDFFHARPPVYQLFGI
jgi:hypothetical protein